jgi:predicted GNAT family acetyltransferase
MTLPASLGRLERTTRDGLAVTVVDVPEASRFEARVDDTVAAYAEYTLDGDHVVFVHTLTEPDWGGRGIASVLAAGAIELVRAAGRRVVPRCPFIADWIHRHPEAADLVDHRHQRLIRPFTPSEETP